MRKKLEATDQLIALWKGTPAWFKNRNGKFFYIEEIIGIWAYGKTREGSPIKKQALKFWTTCLEEPPPKKIKKKRIITLGQAIDYVFEFFNDDEKAMAWFMEPNPNFGGATPLKMILRGRKYKVISFIAASKKESLLP